MRHSLHQRDVIRRAASLLLALTLLAGFAGRGAAQTRRKAPAPAREQAAERGDRNPAGDAGATCGWQGTIEINRNTSEGREQVTAKGEHISDQFYQGKTSIKSSFDYHARLDVQNSPGYFREDGSFSAMLSGSFDANAVRVFEETDDSTTDLECFPDPPRKVTISAFMNITERGTGAGRFVEGPLVVEGARFFFSVGIPELVGASKKTMRYRSGGYCLKESDRNENETSEDAVTFSAEAVRVEGALDPKNPNVIRGEFRPDADTLITWNLSKPAQCDQPLTLRELRLAHHKFPDKVGWAEIDEHTVDGNQVRLLAVVENGSKVEKSGAVTFKELTTGLTLETKPVTVPPKGEAEVEVVWDTNGFAWTDGGEKAPQREIEARLASGDGVSEKVFVNPKPVVMVHGLWSNAAAWAPYQGFLNEAHSFAWRGYAVGANPGVALMNTGDHFGNTAPTNTIAQNARELDKQVRAVQVEENAWHVDLVAHSMGGLISRYYIHALMATDSPDNRPYVTHLVMLGTPNEGSACADLAYPALKLAGHHVESLRQLRPSVVEEFNEQVTNRKRVKFSILAGFPVPRVCHQNIWGDGVVSIPSALWRVADRDYAPRVHTAITGREDFFSFVKPRLALGPKKAQESAALGAADEGNLLPGRNLLASLAPVAAPQNTEAGAPRVLLSKALKLGPGETAEVPVKINEKSDAGVTFVAPPAVRVTLVGAGGAGPAGGGEAGPGHSGEHREGAAGAVREGAEDAGPFQSFYLEEAGHWTLRFVNEGGAAADAFAAVWANERGALALEFTGLEVQPDGGLKLQARVTNEAGAVKGAAVSVRLDGQPSEIPLRDDGAHGDGAAGDGIYGATTASSKAGRTYVEARAFFNGATAKANAFVSGGAR